MRCQPATLILLDPAHVFRRETVRVTIARGGDQDAFEERGEAHSLPSQVLAILLGGSGVTV
jgi:hypothetical protein